MAEEAGELNYPDRIEPVTLESLRVDRSYQRDVSQALVDKIADDWSRVASELLLVSDRGAGREEEWPEKGRYYLVNGQHRSYAARKVGLTFMDARVIDLSEVPDPAKIEAEYRLQTNVRNADKPLERFKAQLRAGNEESVAIVKILERFDTEINLVPTVEHGINAVSTVERLYKLDEGVTLTDTLELVRDIFRVVAGKTASASVLYSLAWFIEKHRDEASRDRVIEKLRLLGIEAWDRRARTIGASYGGSLWMNYYRALVETYNERLQDKSRLEWRLKGSGSRLKGAQRYSASPS